MATTKKVEIFGSRARKFISDANCLSVRETDDISAYDNALLHMKRAYKIILDDVQSRYNKAIEENKQLDELTHTHCAKRRNLSCYFTNELLEHANADYDKKQEYDFSAFTQLYNSHEEFLNFMFLTIATQLNKTYVKELRINDVYCIKTSTQAIKANKFLI